MSLMEGKYDPILEWPFQMSFNLTLLDQYKINGNDEFPDIRDLHHGDLTISINPLTSICRLLRQFTRPYGSKKGDDGCGKAFFVAHNSLLSDSRYILDGNIAVRLTVLLNDRGSAPKRAQVCVIIVPNV